MGRLPAEHQGPRPKVRQRVRQRAGGLCERCASVLQSDSHSHHHRIPRRDNGFDAIGNLLYLCLKCHREIHRNERYAYSRGWMAYPGFDDITPVFIRKEFWAVLRADGTYERVDPVDAREMIKAILILVGARERILNQAG